MKIKDIIEKLNKLSKESPYGDRTDIRIIDSSGNKYCRDFSAELMKVEPQVTEYDPITEITIGEWIEFQDF
jgi:hypothetical protein